MMTLLPMAAFAKYDQNDFSAAASYVTVDKEKVRVDQEAKITLTARTTTGAVIYTPESNNELTFYVKATRDAETYKLNGVDIADASGVISAKGMEVKATPDANGEIKLSLSSKVAGEVKVSLYKEVVSGLGAEDGVLIGSATVEFTSSASSVNRASITAIEHTARGNNTVLDSTSVNPQVGRELTIKARVADEKNNGIANQEVLLQKRFENGSWSTFATKTTDVLGRVEAKFIGEEAGAYEFRVRSGSVNSSIETVTYAAGESASIKASVETRTLEAKGDPQYIRYVVKDALGNISVNPADIDSVEYLKVPADSVFDSGEEVTGLVRQRPGKDELEVPVVFDEVGDYVIRAYVNSGIYADVTVKAREKGDIVSIEVVFQDDEKRSLKATDEPINQDTLNIDVKEIDENGIKFTSQVADDFAFATSSRSLATIDGFTVKGPSTNKDAKGVATITVTHKEYGYTATIDVPVVGGPAAVDYNVVAKNNKSAVVTMQFVDSNGNVTYDKDNADTNYSFVNVPAGVTITNKDSFAKKTGEAEFTVNATDAGNFDLTVVTDNNILVKIPVKFDEEKAPVNKNITLFIGQQVAVVNGDASLLDVAPFIKEGRTFVPVRFVAEALGAEVKYDAATQVVTATRGDDVVVMTIGSNVMTVNGEAQVTDVAPFIVDGRTVLPFRAVAEAFGADVTWDAATQSVVFEM